MCMYEHHINIHMILIRFFPVEYCHTMYRVKRVLKMQANICASAILIILHKKKGRVGLGAGYYRAWGQQNDPHK